MFSLASLGMNLLKIQSLSAETLSSRLVKCTRKFYCTGYYMGKIYPNITTTRKFLLQIPVTKPVKVHALHQKYLCTRLQEVLLE